MTRIGCISDTHDNMGAVKTAVERLNRERVELVCHAGDFIAPFVLHEFGALKCPFVGVFGNNDGERELLRKISKSYENMKICGDFADFVVDEKRIALYHGTQEEITEALFRSGIYDIVICGHTHSSAISQAGSTLLINPGEACGYLTGQSTIAIMDTCQKKTEIITLSP